MAKTILFFISSLVLTGCALEPLRTYQYHNFKNVVRVASYNVHHWKGDDGEKDVERIAQMFKELDADILVVQEVDNNGARPGKRLGNQKRLESMVDGRWVVFTDGALTVHRNGVFVRPNVEVLEIDHVDISEPGRDPRAAVDILVRVRGFDVRVVGAHLGLARGERDKQVEAITEILAKPKEARATIVLGDFNEWSPFADTFSPLRSFVKPVSSRTTFPAWAPIFHLDRIWVSKEVHLHRVGVHRTKLAEIASDHLPVTAELAF